MIRSGSGLRIHLDGVRGTAADIDDNMIRTCIQKGQRPYCLGSVSTQYLCV